jgi:hypothetical protein
MSKLTYYKVVPFSQKEAEAVFANGSREEISNALVGLAYFDEDWEYVRDLCIKFLSDENNKNHSMAAICLGHLARIHRNSEIGKVIPFLESFLSDPEIGGIVEDAIETINHYTKAKKSDSKRGLDVVAQKKVVS